MEFVKTTTNFFGLQIMEPVTAATDLLVSAVCLYAYFKIKSSNSQVPAVFLFKYYFLSMALATAYGGIVGHAFLHLLSFEWKVPGWLISMLSVALIERASIIHAKPILKPGVASFFMILNIIELLTLVTIVLIKLNFFFVEAHATYGLLVIVFSFELYIYRKTKDAGSRILLVAVLISALAAIVHLSKFSLHHWFNHLDLSHVLMAISAYVFYVGAVRIHVSRLTLL